MTNIYNETQRGRQLKADTHADDPTQFEGPDTISQKDLDAYVNRMRKLGHGALGFDKNLGDATLEGKPFVGETAAFYVTKNNDMGDAAVAATLRDCAVVMDIDPNRSYPTYPVTLSKAGELPTVFIPKDDFEKLGLPAKGGQAERVPANVVVVTNPEKEIERVTFDPGELQLDEAALFNLRDVVLSPDGESARLVKNSIPVHYTDRGDVRDHLQEATDLAAVEWVRVEAGRRGRNTVFKNQLTVSRASDLNNSQIDRIPVVGFIASAPDSELAAK